MKLALKFELKIVARGIFDQERLQNKKQIVNVNFVSLIALDFPTEKWIFEIRKNAFLATVRKSFFWVLQKRKQKYDIIRRELCSKHCLFSFRNFLADE